MNLRKELNVLNKLIQAVENSQEAKNAWYDLADAITVETLKETYLNTISGGFSSDPQDIVENFKVNRAIATCLRYFMYRPDAEEFLKEAESERRSD
jgi:hypothetical protein